MSDQTSASAAPSATRGGLFAALPGPLDALPAVLNHLLKPEAWARTRLQAYAGKTAWFTVDPFGLGLTVTPEGYVRRCASAADAAVRISLPLSALPQALMAGAGGLDRALMRRMRLEGDADFAQAISEIASRLRWDAEDDLSKLVGDAAATQISAGVRAVVGQASAAQRKLADNVAEYLLEEQPQLVRPRHIEALADAIRVARDDMARLEKRIERVERSERERLSAQAKARPV